MGRSLIRRMLAVLAALLLGSVAGTTTSARAATPGSPTGSFESATPTTTGIHVSGWALDPDSGDHKVAVGVFSDGTLVAYTPAASGDRPDVGAAFPGYGSAHGFDLTFAAGAGSHQVCVAAFNAPGSAGADQTLGCRTVILGSPIGSAEALTKSDPQTFHITGWALDSDTANPIAVAAFANGQLVAYSSASLARPDIDAAFPGYGANHGFDLAFTLSASGPVCVAGINASGTPGGDRTLGCLMATGASPIGNFEQLLLTPGGLRAAGWTLDTDSPSTPLSVAIYDNGNLVAFPTAANSRPDVGATPGYGDNHGFDVTFGTGYGAHQVCAVAHNAADTIGTDASLGCKSFTNAITMGSLEIDGRSSAFQARVRGWVIDSRTSGPAVYGVVVDGTVELAESATGYRPDVAAAFPGYGPNHGFDASGYIGPGPHQVCVVASDQAVTQASFVFLGCAVI